MSKIIFLLLLFVNVDLYCQNLSKKIITIKIYNDSNFTEENTCFPPMAIQISKNGISQPKFKNYDAYVIDSKSADSLFLNFLTLQLPLNNIIKRFQSDVALEFSIYIDYFAENKSYSLSYFKGMLYQDKNFYSSLFRIKLEIPQFSYSETLKKFTSKSLQLPVQIFNENLTFFLSN